MVPVFNPGLSAAAFIVTSMPVTSVTLVLEPLDTLN